MIWSLQHIVGIVIIITTLKHNGAGADTQTRKSLNAYKPEIPDDCKAKGYCESIPNYPREHVKKLITELGDVVNRFHLDKLNISQMKHRANMRVNPLEKDLGLCESRKEILHLESVQGDDSKWYTVINDKDEPIQGFQAEICTSTNSKCSSIISEVAAGYTVSCRQKRFKRMVAVLDANKKMVEKNFDLPSCCVCVAETVDV